MKAQKSKFSIDGGPSYDGYTFGQRWNGWACPYFELPEALQIAEACSLPEEGYVYQYDATKGLFKAIEGTEPEDRYEIPAQVIETENGPKTVYPLGAFGWVWDDGRDN